MHKQEDCHHMAKERIGILGGTFDPIHDGHIHMALSAMQGAHLDRVLVLPTGNPPHKTRHHPCGRSLAHGLLRLCAA